MLGGGVDDLLDPGDERSEGSYDDPALGLADDPLHGKGDVALGGRVAGDLRPGRIREEQQHPLRPEAGQFGEVRELPIHGRVVQLEVPGMYHGPHRGVDCDAYTVRDTMADGEEFQAEDAELHLIARLDDVQGGPFQELVFFEL